MLHLVLFHYTVPARLDSTRFFLFLHQGQYLVPATFLVPALLRFQASRADINVTSTDCWPLIGQKSCRWKSHEPSHTRIKPGIFKYNSVTVICFSSLALCVTESHIQQQLHCLNVLHCLCFVSRIKVTAVLRSRAMTTPPTLSRYLFGTASSRAEQCRNCIVEKRQYSPI